MQAPRRAWVGREIDLLVEGPSEETDLLWQGRTPLHAPEIDGKVLINDFGPHEVARHRAPSTAPKSPSPTTTTSSPASSTSATCLYQPIVPGAPLNGPTTSDVIHPP